MRKRRGPTTYSLKTSVIAGGPRHRVEFFNHKPVGANANGWKSTVYGWAHSPSVFPQNVKWYDDIPKKKKMSFYERMIDTFEMVEVSIEPTTGKSSLTQSSYEVGSTSSSSSASIDEATTATLSNPCNGANDSLDPMYCIPLSEKTKMSIDNMISDSFRNYRFDIREKYFDKLETNEQMYANPPPDWPDDQWRWIVDWWSSQKYDKMRTRGKNNCKHMQMLHTGGSESFEKKRYGIILEKGGPVDEVKFFIDTHT